MSETTDFQLGTLQVMLDKVDKRLKWAAMLLGVMLIILAIDLQLKRSLARQAVKASEDLAVAHTLVAGSQRLMADLRRDDGRRPSGAAAGRSGDAGDARTDGVDGTAPVAAGPDHPPRPRKPATRRSAAGAGKRAPGNGPGASGGTGE